MSRATRARVLRSLPGSMVGTGFIGRSPLLVRFAGSLPVGVTRSTQRIGRASCFDNISVP
jgi:hypothetical protein